MAKKRKAGGVRPILIPSLGHWYANIGETVNGRSKRVYAPKAVQTERQAWDWLKAKLDERDARRIDRNDPTVFGVCDLFAKWSLRRAEEGGISKKEALNRRTHLTLVYDSEIDGKSIRDMRAREFTAAELGVVVEGWSRGGYEPQYIANVVRTAKAAWKWASDRVPGRDPIRLLDEHTLQGFRPPPVPRGVDRFVEPEIIRRFMRWAWADARRAPGFSKRFDRLFLLMFRFCYLTGARPGEACRLTWEHIRWDVGVVVIPPAEHKTGKKTGKTREIQLTPPVVRLLQAIGGGISPDWHAPMSGPKVWPGLDGRHPTHVFTHRRGRFHETRGDAFPESGEPWASGEVASQRMRKLRRQAIAAGVKGILDVGPKRLVAYTNRHVYASNALMKGLTTSQTAELLGNSAKMVEDVYGHIQRGHVAELAKDLMKRGRRT